MPHTTKTSNMLFAFNPIMKSCHSNRKSKFENSHVTDDIITLYVTWEDILWRVLSCCGLTFFYVWNYKQSYKAYKKNCLKGFWDNFYDNYNLPLSWLLLLLKGQLNSSFLIRLRRDTIAHRLRFDQISFRAGKMWHTGVILTSFRSFKCIKIYKVLLLGKKSSANLCSTEKSFTWKSD